jgi:hypothetical protein
METLNEQTKFDSRNDNRATLPRFTAEAMKANRVLVICSMNLVNEKERPFPRSRSPGCSLLDRPHSWHNQAAAPATESEIGGL